MELNEEEDLAFQDAIKGVYRSAQDPPSDNDPPNAAQYGRLSGLTLDFESVDPLSGVVSVRRDVLMLGRDVLDDSHLTPCLFRPIISSREQLVGGSASSEFVWKVSKPLDAQTLAKLRADVSSFGRSSKDLKLELPALLTDHEVDIRQLRRDIDETGQVCLPNHRLPLEPTDREKDEGLEFPTELQHLNERLLATLEKEVVNMTEENMEFAVQCFQRDWTDREQQDMMEVLTSYRGLTFTTPSRLTPMLSPPISPLQPYVPDEETCQIPIMSDSSSKLSSDLRAAEDAVFDLDENPDFLTSETILSSGSPERYNDVDTSKVILEGGLDDLVWDDLEVQPRSVAGLKLDVPLMSDRSEDLAMSPGINSIETPPDNKSMAIEGLDILMAIPNEEKVAAMLEEKATGIMRSIEEEKLRPTDTTARLPIPVMDFHLPEPDWHKHLGDSRTMFNWIRCNTETVWEAPKWPRKNQAQEMKMVWTPIPAKVWGSVVHRKEAIEDEPQILARLLELPRKVMTSEDLVWKKEGLAILLVDDDEDDEEELLPITTNTTAPQQHDLAMLIKRRKSELELEEQRLNKVFPTPTVPDSQNDAKVLAKKRKKETEPAKSRPQGSTSAAITTAATDNRPPEDDLMAILKRRRQDLEPEWRRQRSKPGPTHDGAFDNLDISKALLTKDGHDASVSLLENYMELKVPKTSRLSHSSFTSPSQTKPARRATSICSSASSETRRNTEATAMPPPTKPLPVATAPQFTIPEFPIRVIVAQIPGRIISLIQQEIPGIEMIQRDYDAHNSTTWHPGSVISSVVLSPLADEADIIVSPATGVLITTMLRVRQKPLPGSKTKAFLRARIERISTRYERLLIIVSEGNAYSESVHKLAPTDVAALAEFRGFAEGLGSHTSVYYIGGGESTVAKWAAALICRHAAENAETSQYALAAETRSELFLRRAGMNVCAAQVVLGMTRAPPGVLSMGTDRIYGLAAFLKLTLEQRIDHFEKLLGGRRLLEMTSRNIDKNWDD